MSEWKLTENYQTSAGRVSAGQCGDGPDLILAHGWPWSSYSWHRLIPELAKTYKVHWYDMPGYGQSEKKVLNALPWTFRVRCLSRCSGIGD